MLKDKIFYDNSGGGMTLSGGEPLFQYDFSMELLKKAKENGIKTAVETCGYTVKPLEEMSRYVDLWLYDIKILDEELHKKHTGVSNEVILKNLKFLAENGSDVILRCPIIPGVNMNYKHFNALASLTNDLKYIKAIHIEPYHPLGISKAERLGREQQYTNNHFLEKEKLYPFVDELRNKVNVDVIIW